MIKAMIHRIKKRIEAESSSGYTLIEVIIVASIVTLIAMMGMGAQKSVRKHSFERQCVTRLKQIAQYQESYRNIGDPSINPDGSYGTFFQLQSAGYIPVTYDVSDTPARDGQPFIPFYEVEIVRSPTAMNEEPNRNQYMVKAWPIENPFGLRVFMMLEDGEVYFYSRIVDGELRVWK